MTSAHAEQVGTCVVQGWPQASDSRQVAGKTGSTPLCTPLATIRSQGARLGHVAAKELAVGRQQALHRLGRRGCGVVDEGHELFRSSQVCLLLLRVHGPAGGGQVRAEAPLRCKAERGRAERVRRCRRQPVPAGSAALCCLDRHVCACQSRSQPDVGNAGAQPLRDFCA